jgi:hypothetical protein
VKWSTIVGHTRRDSPTGSPTIVDSHELLLSHSTADCSAWPNAAISGRSVRGARAGSRRWLAARSAPDGVAYLLVDLRVRERRGIADVGELDSRLTTTKPVIAATEAIRYARNLAQPPMLTRNSFHCVHKTDGMSFYSYRALSVNDPRRSVSNLTCSGRSIVCKDQHHLPSLGNDPHGVTKYVTLDNTE